MAAAQRNGDFNTGNGAINSIPQSTVFVNGEHCADVLMKEGHAVAYNGGNKDSVQAQHLINRQRLIDEGKVPAPEGMTLTPNKTNTFKATKPPLRAKKKKKK